MTSDFFIEQYTAFLLIVSHRPTNRKKGGLDKSPTIIQRYRYRTGRMVDRRMGMNWNEHSAQGGQRLTSKSGWGQITKALTVGGRVVVESCPHRYQAPTARLYCIT